jgi:sugar diacid utilization regulator
VASGAEGGASTNHHGFVAVQLHGLPTTVRGFSGTTWTALGTAARSGTREAAHSSSAFVTSGYNRGEAATALNIHRNTLTYPLGRIQLITGYDATRPADARHLAVAITAYDIVRRTG